MDEIGENERECQMMAVSCSRKQKDRAQGYLDAAEGAAGTKNKQTQIDSWGKRPSRMKMLEARAWAKALIAAEESLAKLRQRLLIAHAPPAACSAPWPEPSNAARRSASKADLKHQIANLILQHEFGFAC